MNHADYEEQKLNCRNYPKKVVDYLNKVYAENKYLSLELRKKIALDTRLTEKQIKNWFQRKRIRNNHSHLQPYTRYPLKTVNYLNRKYQRNKFPSLKERALIAKTTKLSPKQVKAWFDAKRIKMKHSQKKNHYAESVVEVLNNYFKQNSYPNQVLRRRIANEVKLSEKQVTNWFQDKRTRLKKTINK